MAVEKLRIFQKFDYRLPVMTLKIIFQGLHKKLHYIIKRNEIFGGSTNEFSFIPTSVIHPFTFAGINIP